MKIRYCNLLIINSFIINKIQSNKKYIKMKNKLIEINKRKDFYSIKKC